MRTGIPPESKCVTATCSNHTSPRPSGRRNRNVIECERSSGRAMFKRVVTVGRSSGWICLTHSALLRDCFGPRPRISAAFWLSRIRPMRRSQSKVITPPARSASSSRLLSFEDREFVYPSLAEQSRQNKRAERSGQNGRLRRQDALLKRQTRIAEKANGKYCCPYNRDRAHERCDGRKGRANAGGDPHEQRTERGNRQFECPRHIRQNDQE